MGACVRPMNGRVTQAATQGAARRTASTLRKMAGTDLHSLYGHCSDGAARAKRGALSDGQWRAAGSHGSRIATATGRRASGRVAAYQVGDHFEDTHAERVDVDRRAVAWEVHLRRDELRGAWTARRKGR